MYIHSPSFLIMTFDHRGRTWALGAFNTVSKDLVLKHDDVAEVLVMEIPKCAWRAGAISFDEWSASLPESQFWRQQLHMFLHLANKVVATYKERSLKKDNKVPLKVFMEHVFADNDTAHDRRVPKVVAYRFHMFLLWKQEPVSAGSEDVKTVEPPSLGRLFWEMLDEHAVDTEKRQKTHRRYVMPIEPYEFHRYIDSPEHYYKVLCGLYLNNDIIWSSMDTAVICTPEVPFDTAKIQWDTFKAHPVNVYSYDTMARRTRSKNDLQRRGTSYKKRCLLDDDDDEYPEYEYMFPYPDAVIRLDFEQLKLQRFHRKYFPDYQKYRLSRAIEHLGCHVTQLAASDMSMEDRHRVDGDNVLEQALRKYQGRVFDKTLLHEFGADLLHANKALQAAMTSDFKMLSLAAARDPIHDLEPTETGYLGHRRAYQLRQLDEFKSRCWDEDARVSHPAKEIIRFYKKKQVLVPTVWPSCKNISVFGNLVTQKMEQFEHLALISTAHRKMLLLYFARLDAYRANFGLHFNIFATGKGATSKSFLFEELARFSIHKTMEELSYQTTRADAIDGHRNDTITVMHEAPAGFFQHKSLKTADPAEALLKEKLTSNRVKCKTFERDEDTGIRSNRVTESECIGVWFGATNDDPSQVSEALRSRFMWIGFDEMDRKGRNIQDLMQASRLLSADDKRHQKNMYLAGKQDQMIFFAVEKFILTKIIKDVSMDTANVIFRTFEKVMIENSTARIHPRCSKRLKIMARALTIAHAIEHVFRIPTGKHYGKAFTLDMVLDMEPYLFCTEEIALFTVGLLEEQYVNPAQAKVIDALRRIERHEMKKDTGLDPTRFNPKVRNNDTEENQITYDYNYVKFNHALGKLVNQVSNQIPAAKGRPSDNNIKTVLVDLCKTTITHAPYKEPGPNGIPVASGLPIALPGAKYDRKYVCIHTALLHDTSLDDVNRIKRAIDATQHEGSQVETFVSGQVLRQASGAMYPNLFQVLSRRPNGKPLNEPNALYNTDASKRMLGMSTSSRERSVPLLRYTNDLDTMAREKHHARLGLPLEEGAYYDRRYLYWKLLDHLHKSGHELRDTYPDTYVAELQARSQIPTLATKEDLEHEKRVHADHFVLNKTDLGNDVHTFARMKRARDALRRLNPEEPPKKKICIVSGRDHVIV